MLVLECEILESLSDMASESLRLSPVSAIYLACHCELLTYFAVSPCPEQCLALSRCLVRKNSWTRSWGGNAPLGVLGMEGMARRPLGCTRTPKLRGKSTWKGFLFSVEGLQTMLISPTIIDAQGPGSGWRVELRDAARRSEASRVGLPWAWKPTHPSSVCLWGLRPLWRSYPRLREHWGKSSLLKRGARDQENLRGETLSWDNELDATKRWKWGHILAQ